MIRCRSASKSLWRNSPSALAPRAASTEEHAILICRGVIRRRSHQQRRNPGQSDPPCPLSSSRRAFFCRRGCAGPAAMRRALPNSGYTGPRRSRRSVFHSWILVREPSVEHSTELLRRGGRGPRRGSSYRGTRG
jgi:hypothetical protein